MDKYIIPHYEENETGGQDADAFGKHTVSVPENLTNKAKIGLHSDFLNSLGKTQVKLEEKIASYKEEVNEYRNDLKKQSSRNIEIIGLFSSVLALLIINVNIVMTAPNFLGAILLIAALTCSLVIFAGLIHNLFSEDQTSKPKSIWIGIGGLSVLIIVGIIFHAFGWNVYDYQGSAEAQNQEISTEE